MLKKKFSIVTALLLAICLISHEISGQIFPLKESALAADPIVKLAIPSSGVYRITKKNLDDYGFNTATLNPKNLKIYTNYGGMLPEPIAQSYPDDLIELPIFINGEGDGKMNDNDYIIFYAEGADHWKYNSTANDYFFDKNIYDHQNYVFLKLSNESGKRIEKKSITNPEFSTRLFQQFQIFSEDKTNLLGANLATNGSGKLWVGEYLVAGQERDLSSAFDFTGLDVSKGIKVQMNAYGRSGSESRFTLLVDALKFETRISSVSLTNDEAIYARLGNISQLVAGPSASPKLKLTYTAPSGGDAWLDYLSVSSYQEIRLFNKPIWIRLPEFANFNTSAIVLNEANANARIWKVNDLSNITEFSSTDNKTFATETGEPNSQFILFADQQASSPVFISKLANQNLHGLSSDNLIIIYPEVFKEAALKLADHRRSHNKYNTTAVPIDAIFNEFSSGRKDVSAIRNFAKMLLDRNPDFKYLLLFGDGTYDYKNLVSNIPDHNFVPVYETNESLSPINAFPTDDYYALLSNNEGNNLDGALDISVGRLTVTTSAEALAVVEKIINYDTSPSRFGEWRLNSSFAADDEDSNLHFRDANKIAEESFANDPLYNQQKIYFDAYTQENTPGGERYNDATDAINRNMDKGLLTWCYLGHGGPKGLAQERVVKIPDITSWNNFNNPALMVTATCSFTGYDDPTITSGGEEAILNPKGGAIALLTTTRPVYASENARLTSSVYKNMFKKINGKRPTFGQIFNLAKNATFQDTTGDNTRKFSLIGDPSQELAIPEHQISITTINGIEASIFNTPVSAYDEVVFEGEVTNDLGSVLSDFNGDLVMTIYDKASILKTLANDETSKVAEFRLYRNIIFKGSTRVVNGRFTIECIIPKDINYSIGLGRISIYAHNGQTDAAGYYAGLLIGGNSNATIEDNTPPEMGVFMNDVNFVSGGITNTNPNIFLDLSDDLGINITGNSIGHDITARLTGEGIDEQFILNEFYKAYPGATGSGYVSYPLSDLKPGKYLLEAKAWDISNNSVEGSVEFVVVDDDHQSLVKVYNYPNPFDDFTNFSFEHDLTGEDLEINIKIYATTGSLVANIVQYEFASGFRGKTENWNSNDQYGSNLASGLYLYQITIKGVESKLSRSSDLKKMIKF